MSAKTELPVGRAKIKGITNHNSYEKMKIAFIGTYSPRECGIGTFNKNLVDSVIGNKTNTVKEVEGFVVAMNDYEQDYPYPEEVKLKIRQEQQADYLEAANFINLNGADLCSTRINNIRNITLPFIFSWCQKRLMQSADFL